MPGSDYDNNIRLIWYKNPKSATSSSSGISPNPNISLYKQQIASLKRESKQHHQEIISLAEGEKDNEL